MASQSNHEMILDLPAAEVTRLYASPGYYDYRDGSSEPGISARWNRVRRTDVSSCRRA